MPATTATASQEWEIDRMEYNWFGTPPMQLPLPDDGFCASHGYTLHGDHWGGYPPLGIKIRQMAPNGSAAQQVYGGSELYASQTGGWTHDMGYPNRNGFASWPPGMYVAFWQHDYQSESFSTPFYFQLYDCSSGA